MIRIVIYEYFRLKICGRSPFNDASRNIRIFSSQKRPHIKRKRSQKRRARIVQGEWRSVWFFSVKQIYMFLFLAPLPKSHTILFCFSQRSPPPSVRRSKKIRKACASYRI